MYAVTADIERIYPGELAISAPLTSAGTVDNAAVDAALSYAARRIDEILGVAYQVPVSPIPVSLLDIACDLALHRMSIGLRATEEKEKRHDAALLRLRAIASGRETLPGLVSLRTAEAGASGPVVFSGPPRRFGRGSL